MLPETYNHFLGSEKLRKHKDELWNRYRNSVLYVDDVLRQLLALFAAAPGGSGQEPLLVVTGDSVRNSGTTACWATARPASTTRGCECR